MTAEARARRNGRPGVVVWLTGLSGAGKSTIAVELEWQLVNLGFPACLLDGDNIRNGLCKDLSFSTDDRHENIRRIGEVAKLLADTELICIVAFISPFRRDRLAARNLLPPGRFLEVFINAPLTICEQRDPKGLYAKARQGKIAEFTGLTSPYEAPENPEIELRTDQLTVDESVRIVLARLESRLFMVTPDNYTI
ncbi:MAG TPA: adenylyl-sulfate kinase [Verrucomicrobiae bacterium]